MEFFKVVGCRERKREVRGEEMISECCIVYFFLGYLNII